MKKNTTESKLVYLGKMKKKMINALYQCGVLLPENASWQKILNGVAYLRAINHIQPYEINNKLDLVKDGMKLHDIELIDAIMPNEYDPECKYPIKVSKDMDLSFVDVDSPNYDFNVALAMYLLHIPNGYLSSLMYGSFSSVENFKSNVISKLTYMSDTLLNGYDSNSTSLNDRSYWKNLENGL